MCWVGPFYILSPSDPCWLRLPRRGIKPQPFTQSGTRRRNKAKSTENRGSTIFICIGRSSSRSVLRLVVPGSLGTGVIVVGGLGAAALLVVELGITELKRDGEDRDTLALAACTLKPFFLIQDHST